MIRSRSWRCPPAGPDEMQVSLRYGDGSLATITYLTNAHRRFPKETFEVSSGGRTARLDNFRRTTVWAGARALGSVGISVHRTRVSARRSRPSSHAVRTGGPMPISLDSLAATTRATLAAAAPLSRIDTPQTVTLGVRPEGCLRRPVMNSVELEWRLRRLSKMSASEVRWRISDHVRRRRWASRQIMPECPPAVLGHPFVEAPGAPWDSVRDATFPTLSFRGTAAGRSRRGCVAEVIAAADEILAGQWELLGSLREDMEDPDWFFDPVTGRRAPQVDYCFNVNHRSEDVTGNVKQIWELSRMHHLTVLAAAFASRATSAMPNAPPPISVPGGLRTRSSLACTGRAESRPGYG